MKLPRVCWRPFYAGILCLFLGLVHPGCAKKNTVVLDNSTFNSAPPELRENWKAAGQYVSKNNYLGAATNLIALFSKSQQLTPEQNEALNQVWVQLSNQAFEAANNGDKAATEAVLKMKESGVGNRRGQ